MQLELALVKTGVISAKDYVDAVTRRDRERPPLGQLAIEEGLVSASQVLDVLRAQTASPGRRFGELAVEKGYLDTHQVASLLMHQRDRERSVLEHLVELGRLSSETAESIRWRGLARSASVAV